jgi:hypothetical protein
VIERLDLPLRDVLRFALPGFLAAAYAEALTYLLTAHAFFPAAVTPAYLLLALFFGLLSFGVGIHKRAWPWRSPWNAFLDAIRSRLAEISENPQLEQEPRAKPVYKLWLEATDDQRELRSHLQYSTGVFYGLASMTAWSALFSLAAIVILILSLCDLAKANSPLSARIAVPAIGLLASTVFGYQSRSSLRDLSGETQLALGLPEVREKLEEYFEAASE